jgi:hypothetical protein
VHAFCRGTALILSSSSIHIVDGSFSKSATSASNGEGGHLFSVILLSDTLHAGDKKFSKTSDTSTGLVLWDAEVATVASIIHELKDGRLCNPCLLSAPSCHGEATGALRTTGGGEGNIEAVSSS